MKVAAASPIEITIDLPSFTLEAGATISEHRVRAFVWSTEEDQRAITAKNKLDSELPTVLVIHALTHSARVAGEGGFWDALVGDGRPLRPWAHRIVSFNLLGSCFGTTGPSDSSFPKRVHDTRFSPCPPLVRGMPTHDDDALPATVTTWDQARSILFALDALGIGEVSLAVGGSIGGMVALTLAMLAPSRFHRIAPIAAPLCASAWMIGWNHAARAAILSDPDFPRAKSGLRVARQIARMTYRTPESLAARQGRRIAGPANEHDGEAWSSRTPYRVETYLDHAGDAFDFDARSYLTLTSAMDHHDLLRNPDDGSRFSLDRITADVDLVAIDSDRLVPRAEIDALGHALSAAGVSVTTHTLTSIHGHDAFLCEHTEMHRILSLLLRNAKKRMESGGNPL